MTNRTNPQGYDQQGYPQQQYNQPPQPQYAPPPPPQPVRQYPPGYNPEKESIKSMLNIAGIVAIIFGIIFILLAAWGFYWAMTASSYLSAYVDTTWLYIGPSVEAFFGVMNLVIFMQTKSISAMVDRGQYIEAKSKTLIWTILGFIIGGVIIGIVLLIAYLKFDPLIRGQMPQQYPPRQQPYQQALQQPQYQQQPYQQAPPPQPVQQPPQPQQPQDQQYPPQ